MRAYYGPAVVLVFSRISSGNLLGAGKGLGSCAAYPFRSYEVHWALGCPPFAPCCSEFGYCRPREEWDHGNFRDCNGVSNGTPLPQDVLLAEAAAGPYHGKPAGAVGPPPNKNHFPPSHGANSYLPPIQQQHNNQHHHQHAQLAQHDQHGPHDQHSQIGQHGQQDTPYPLNNIIPQVNNNYQAPNQYPQNNHASQISSHQNVPQHGNYLPPNQHHQNNHVGHGQQISHNPNHPTGQNLVNNYLPPNQNTYGMNQINHNAGPFITPTPDAHVNHPIPNQNIYNGNAPKLKFVPELPQTGRGPYFTTNPPLSHQTPTTAAPFHGNSPSAVHLGPTQLPSHHTNHQARANPFMTPSLVGILPPNNGPVSSNNIPNLNHNFVTPLPNIHLNTPTPFPFRNNDISSITPVPIHHQTSSFLTNTNHNNRHSQANVQNPVSHTTILPQIQHTTQPTASSIQFSRTPGPNPRLTGLGSNNIPSSPRHIKTTHILSDLTPPPNKLNNVQINGLSNQELHSMMAFVHTMQSTPENEGPLGTPHIPHHPHEPIPHNSPQVPTLPLGQNPPLTLPRQQNSFNEEINQNIGVRGHGSKSIQNQNNQNLGNHFEPTPNPSIIHRPLFDPRNSGLNIPTINPNHNILRTPSPLHHPQHSNNQPPNLTLRPSHPTTPLPHQQSLFQQQTPPFPEHHSSHHEPHPSHHNSAHLNHHSTAAPQHTFAVENHQHPPMMPVMAGTTTECQHPDGTGGYTCVTFGTTKRPAFDISSGHGIGFTADHGSRIKRKELKAEQNEQINVKSSIPNMDFNLVLSPKSTQFLKQMFQTNIENNGQNKQTLGYQTTQIPATTNILTPGNYNLIQNPNRPQEPQNSNQNQPLIFQLSHNNQQLLQQTYQTTGGSATNTKNNPLVTKPPSLIILGQEPIKKKPTVAYSLVPSHQRPNIGIKTPTYNAYSTTQIPVKLLIRNIHADKHGFKNVPTNILTNPEYNIPESSHSVYQQQEVTLTHVNPSKTPPGHQPNTINNSPRLDISSPPLVPAIAGTTTQCQLPDGHGTYTCISFENIHPENKHLSVYNSNRRSDQVKMESRSSKKYALVKSKPISKEHSIINDEFMSDHTNLKDNTDTLTQNDHAKAYISGKSSSIIQPKKYLHKYKYGQTAIVPLNFPALRDNQNRHVHSGITGQNSNNEFLEIKKQLKNRQNTFKDKRNSESNKNVEQIKTNDHFNVLPINSKNNHHLKEDKQNHLINTNHASHLGKDNDTKKSDKNPYSDLLQQKSQLKINEYNKTRENILHMRKQKINAIIEKAVKRALKFNGGNKNVHQDIFNKGVVLDEPKTTTVSTATTTTTLLPLEAVSTTKMPDYAPILNPITGKPIGLVSNSNGKFFAINEENQHPDMDTTTESSKTTEPTIYENIYTTADDEKIGRDDPETSTSGHKHDITPQIDPTLESLTREFMDLLQGEKSAISPPIYV